MNDPTGTYNTYGHLVADRHGVPLTLIQDPDTGDRIWITPTGRMYHRAPPVVTGDQSDVDRLNARLQELPGRALHPTDHCALIVVTALVALATLTFWMHR